MMVDTVFCVYHHYITSGSRHSVFLRFYLFLLKWDVVQRLEFDSGGDTYLLIEGGIVQQGDMIADFVIVGIVDGVGTFAQIGYYRICSILGAAGVYRAGDEGEDVQHLVAGGYGGAALDADTQQIDVIGLLSFRLGGVGGVAHRDGETVDVGDVVLSEILRLGAGGAGGATDGLDVHNVGAVFIEEFDEKAVDDGVQSIGGVVGLSGGGGGDVGAGVFLLLAGGDTQQHGHTQQ